MRSVAVVVALVAFMHAAVWGLIQHQTNAPEFDQVLPSVSYSPFEGVSQDNEQVTPDKIRADLKAIAPYTRAIRTYSSINGREAIPQIAAELGLKVTLGIWMEPIYPSDTPEKIKKKNDRREAEIKSALDLAKRYSNVVALVVGNETVLRAEKPKTADGHRLKLDEFVPELLTALQQVKRQSPVPITTGETWDVWIDYPELAAHVDFIAAHILPYWDGVKATNALNQTMLDYAALRQMHPGKRIVIAEFGWPSAGYNRNAAEPGRLEQAAVLRQFVTRADQLGIDYNIIEAFDQPWKTREGSVGAYWGLFDSDRTPKFSWSGVVADGNHWKLAAIAVGVGFLLSLPIVATAGVTVGQTVLLATAAHGIGAWTAVVFDYWDGHYFVLGSAFALILGLILLVPLLAIAMARIDEIAAIVFGRPPARLIRPSAAAPAGYAPKVSIHVPAYREPPEMLKATLDSVAALDYPNYECVVIINNTPDPAYWRPIEEHCRALGERFKFINAEKVEGFKAGALRLALARTAPDAEIIGVIDADYAVTSDWLKDLVPAFADPKVGLVQAPQDHRDGSRSPLHMALNAEYAGFFDIGMVQRNETNSIITHGTMCLIRRAAMDDAGGWSSDTICEDTDLGLTILERGWLAHYTNRRYGYGLLPDTFDAYKKQHHRWAYGGLQIVKKHWRRFLPGVSRLTVNQRREFLIGWVNWMGAESVGVVLAILNLLWIPIVTGSLRDILGQSVPDKVLTLPILAAVVVSTSHFVTLYRQRVALPTGPMIGGMLAAMALQWTVARAVGFGLIKDHLPFVRTAKGGAARRGVNFPAMQEAVLGVALLLGAGFVIGTNYERVREINLFGYVLIVQSLPFLAAAAMALFESSRFNDFAYVAQVRSRAVELLTRRPAFRRIGQSVQTRTAVKNRVGTAQ
jgi:cellulose synthase/poly-beta-1,6-N-acetylglucosamine synthase-like glycosyltransferase/exo-beta-1,3-glucanase (GH17 family)